jgi:hypothetical protein
MGTIMASGLGHLNQVFDVALQPIDKRELLRFTSDDDNSTGDLYTMTLTLPNQTGNQWLALPDETGILLSTSSTFSTLTTLGVLIELEVAGNTRLNADVTLGNTRSDQIILNGSLTSDAATPAYCAEAIIVADTYYPSGSFVNDVEYTIAVAGSTSWTAIGAADNNVGTTFVSTGWGGGNGVATLSSVEEDAAACALVTDVSTEGPCGVPLTKASDDAQADTLSAVVDVPACAYVPSVDAPVPGRSMTFEGAAFDNNVLHLAITEPEGDNTITLPDETGLVLTDVSTYSTLTAVGDLSVGNIVAGFGVAHVTSLTTAGLADFQGDINIGSVTTCDGDTWTGSKTACLESVGDCVGSTPAIAGTTSKAACEDVPAALTVAGAFTSTAVYATSEIQFEGTVVGDDGIAFVFRGPEAVPATPDDFDLIFDIGTLTAMRTITLPDIDGNILTDQSTVSVLEEVGDLSKGSLVAGFGDATVEEITATSTATFEQDLFLGTFDADANTRSPIDIGGRIVNSQIQFDPETGGGSTVLIFTEPAAVNQYITFPTLPAPYAGTVLTDISPRADGLKGVGTLESGSITEGFGEIRTNNDVHLVENSDPTDLARYQDRANLFVYGDVWTDQRMIFSTMGAQAATPTTLVDDMTTLFTINPTSNAGGNRYKFKMPECDGTTLGQMVIVSNEHTYTMLHADAAGAVDHAVPRINPNHAATHFCVGNGKWIQTSNHCSRPDANDCLDACGGTVAECA